jgi:multiple sugar transport system permease protein
MKNYISKTIRSLFIAIYLLVILFPVYWLISMSFRNLKDVIASPPNWLPKSFTLVNYADVLLGKGVVEKGIVGAENILPFLLNSLIISSIATLICMVFGTTAAYGLVKGNPRKMNKIAFSILAIRMIPPVILITPLFILMRPLNLLNTHMGLALIYAAFNLPFAIWMMRGFLMDIPSAIEEAALIDGCNTLTAFFRVIIPIIRPGLAASAVFTFLQAWNEFFFAVVLTRTPKAQTLPVAASFFVREGMTGKGMNIGAIAVVGTFAIIPMIIFVSLVHKWLVRGLTFGAVKG